MQKIIDITLIIHEKRQAKITGCLFLLDNEQHLLEVYFVRGEITCIQSKNITGMRALDKLTTMNPIKAQFHDDIEPPSIDNIPATLDIIDKIKEAKSHQPQKPLPQPIEDKAKSLFTEYVGPIADIIFEEQIEKSTSLSNLIQTLSSYIDDDNAKQSFVHSAKNISQKA